MASYEVSLSSDKTTSINQENFFIQTPEVCNIRLKYCISALPVSLCLKKSNFAAGKYEVWSVEDIPAGTRFGPFQGTFEDIVNHGNKRGFPYEGERNGREACWIQYINFACVKEEQNVIAVQSKSEVYYITCKHIRANQELLVWCHFNRIENAGGSDATTLSTEEEIKDETMHMSHTEEFKSSEECNFSNNYCQVPVLFPGYGNFGNVFSLGETVFILHKASLDYYFYDSAPALEEHCECSICGKKFSRHKNLKAHEMIHLNSRPYKCNICGKRYNVRRSLFAHKRIHTGIKPHECNLCGKRFYTRSSLMIHERSHTGEKPYECNECEKKFCTRNQLTLHELSHAGEKPFECNICGNKFLTKSRLVLHEQAHTFWLQ